MRDAKVFEFVNFQFIDLLVSCYSRKRKEYDYLRIPQDLVKSTTFSFEYDYNTRELSKRTWVRDYKMSLKEVLYS